MYYNNTEVSFQTLQTLAIQAAPEMEEEILAATTASWVMADGRGSSRVVGDENNFGVYVGLKHTLKNVNGPIWVNFTK